MLSAVWDRRGLSGQLSQVAIGEGEAARSCSDGRHLPWPERIASEHAKGSAGGQVRLGIEGVVDGGVSGEESLG